MIETINKLMDILERLKMTPINKMIEEIETCGKMLEPPLPDFGNLFKGLNFPDFDFLSPLQIEIPDTGFLTSGFHTGKNSFFESLLPPETSVNTILNDIKIAAPYLFKENSVNLFFENVILPFAEHLALPLPEFSIFPKTPDIGGITGLADNFYTLELISKDLNLNHEILADMKDGGIDIKNVARQFFSTEPDIYEENFNVVNRTINIPKAAKAVSGNTKNRVNRVLEKIERTKTLVPKNKENTEDFIETLARGLKRASSNRSFYKDY